VRRVLVQSFPKHVQELTQGNSTYAKIINDLKALQSPVMTIAQQYRDLMDKNLPAMQSIKAWREAERTQYERMRKMLDPLADIRKGLLADSATQQIIKELSERATGRGALAQALALAEESRAQNKQLFENLGVNSHVQNYLKDFERINKQWAVPSEVLGIVGSFKAIQEQLGRVTLPTIDWGSAGALARVLGREGIEEQLALLGIGADGVMPSPAEVPKKGILSYRPSEGITLFLVNLLITFLIFHYQENLRLQDKAENEIFQAQTAQQIQRLTNLIEQNLAQITQKSEDRFVVRDRIATVRSKPEHGAAIEGKLFPNEVVLSIDRKGRWVEVEYYHWLQEEYRTGWVLKHYLERVPANYSREDIKTDESRRN